MSPPQGPHREKEHSFGGGGDKRAPRGAGGCCGDIATSPGPPAEVAQVLAPPRVCTCVCKCAPMCPPPPAHTCAAAATGLAHAQVQEGGGRGRSRAGGQGRPRPRPPPCTAPTLRRDPKPPHLLPKFTERARGNNNRKGNNGRGRTRWGGVLGDQDAGRAPLGPLGALFGGGPGVVLPQQADVVLLAELRQLPALGLQLLAQRLQDFADLGEETKSGGGQGSRQGVRGVLGVSGSPPPGPSPARGCSPARAAPPSPSSPPARRPPCGSSAG